MAGIIVFSLEENTSQTRLVTGTNQGVEIYNLWPQDSALTTKATVCLLQDATKSLAGTRSPRWALRRSGRSSAWSTGSRWGLPTERQQSPRLQVPGSSSSDLLAKRHCQCRRRWSLCLWRKEKKDIESVSGKCLCLVTWWFGSSPKQLD